MSMFKELDDMYKNSVKKEDKKGYGKLFKSATEALFDSIKSEDGNITVEDLKYLDGYYIFGMGSNSVVHFHIKECPDWKFGIWWDTPTVSGAKSFGGSFFAQFEKTIDKFKPSRSVFNCSIDYAVNDDGSVELLGDLDILRTIQFIRDEPNLAFCRDYYGWNYNLHHATREEAKAKYDDWNKWYTDKIKYTKENDDRVMNFVAEKIIPLFPKSYIVDDGPYTSPRYSLIAPYKFNKDIVEEPGLYGWFDETNALDSALKKTWELLIKSGEDTAKVHSFWWSHPIHDSIYFYGVTLDDGIDMLNLPTVTYNALLRAGINTIKDLAECDKKGELETVRYIGKKRLNEIRGKLAEFGVDLDDID